MRYLKKINLISESISRSDVESTIDIIIDSVIDLIDEDRNIKFNTPSSSMSYNDYVEKNSKYKSFDPYINTGNFIKSNFSITFYDIKDHSDFLLLNEQMKSVIGKLGEDDWNIYDMKILTSPKAIRTPGINFTFITFLFYKEDKKLDSSSMFKEPNRTGIFKLFDNYGLQIDSYSFHDSPEIKLIIEYNSVSFRDIMNLKIEDLFENICDRYGFNFYDYNHYSVTFTVT
jgi:hypothetical protein